MRSVLDAPRALAREPLIGCQTPRIISTPHYRRIETGRWSGLEDQEALAFRSPAGQEAIDLAADSGIELDPWQQLGMHHSLAEDDEGLWVCFEIVLNVTRQNGKGGWLEARQLAGLLLFGDKLIIHTAHEFKTAQESFRRLDHIIEGSYSLSRRVKRVTRANGEEGFEFFNGARLRFLARSGSSGRGFSGDLVVMDEAMKLRADPIGALLPVMSARHNPQLLYAGSAGLGADSEQLATLRARALADTDQPDPSLAYLEWSIAQHIDECLKDERTGEITCTDHDNREDPTSWARSNPALGIRIRSAHVAREMATMRRDLFDRERLGVGDYPSVEEDAWSVIDEEAWRALADAEAGPEDPVAFAIDMPPERTYTAIVVAGQCGQAVHTEVVEHRPGTGWVVERAVELAAKWNPAAWVIDAGGPAGSLIPELEKALKTAAEKAKKAGAEIKVVEVTAPKVREIGQATGAFIDRVAEQTLVHHDDAPFATALAGAQLRPLGEASAWARRSEGVDISPLVAATFAVWGFVNRPEDEEEEAPNLW